MNLIDDDVAKKDLIVQLQIVTGDRKPPDELVKRSLKNLYEHSSYLEDGFYSVVDIVKAVDKTLRES